MLDVEDRDRLAVDERHHLLRVAALGRTQA